MAKSTRRAEPRVVRPDDIDPKHRWDRPLQAPGRTQVDCQRPTSYVVPARVRVPTGSARKTRPRRSSVPVSRPLESCSPDQVWRSVLIFCVARSGAAVAAGASGSGGSRRSARTGRKRRTARGYVTSVTCVTGSRAADQRAGSAAAAAAP